MRRGKWMGVRLAIAAATVGLAPRCAAPAASAGALVRFDRIQGVDSPGTPAKYDRVGILKTGPRRAPTSSSSTPAPPPAPPTSSRWRRRSSPRPSGWQVWAVERRENLLEDHSVFNRAKAGKATPQQVFDYYLGWLTDPSITKHFQLIPDADVAYAKEWGMKVEIGDLRRVVNACLRPRAPRRRRRALPGRLDHHRLRHLGLQRQAGGEGPRRPRSTSTAAAARPRRSTPSEANAGAEDLMAPDRLAVAGVRRDPLAVHGPVQHCRGAGDDHRPECALAGLRLPAAAGEPEAAGPADQRGPVRLRARHRDLAARAGRRPGPPRPPRRERQPPRLGAGGRDHPDPPLRQGVRRLGAEEPRRHRLVSPAEADDRRRRGRRRATRTRRSRCSRCGRSTATICRGS